MNELTAGCRCSSLKVYPTHWNTDPQSVYEQWYIKYRFYDPAHLQPKQVLIKGMNTIANWNERVKHTSDLLSSEWRRLQSGYNPFLPVEINYTMLDALEYARTQVQVAHNTRIDMKSTLKYFGEAAKRLKWDTLSVQHVRRKHVRAILENCYTNTRFTHNTFNHYRKYLLILFTYLSEEIEMIEHNPVAELSKKKVEFVQREVLSTSDREVVPKFLKDNYYSFYRFMQIFFHSGTRRSELLQVRKRDVNLKAQTFWVMIKKGSETRREQKVIMNCVLDMWTEIMNYAHPSDYLFSVDLMPGPKAIRPEQVTRRWYKHVKVKKKVTADFYSLKHLHTDLIAEMAGIEAAAEHDSHTSTAVTKKHYAINEKKREQQMRRTLDIKL